MSTSDGLNRLESRTKLRGQLDFAFGRGFVTLQAPRIAPWLDLRLLRVEIPDLRFPFDIQGGIDRFRGIRTLTRRLELRIDIGALEERIWRALHHVPGVEHIRLRCEDNALRLLIRLSAMGRHGLLVVDLTLAPPAPESPALLHLVPARLRTFGTLAFDAHRTFQHALDSLLAHGAPRPALPQTVRATPGEVIIDVVRLVGATVLLPAGWKLAGGADLRLREARFDEGTIDLRFASDRDATPAARMDDAVYRRGTRARTRLERLFESISLHRGITGSFDELNDADPGTPEMLEAWLDHIVGSGTPDDRLRARTALEAKNLAPAESQRLLARLAETGGEQAKAGALLDSVASLVTDDTFLADATRWHRLHADLGQSASARLEQAKELRRRWPGDPDLLRAQANAADRLGDLDAVMDALDRLQQCPVSPTERLNALERLIPLVAERAGDLERAGRLLDRALELAPDQPGLRLDHAHVLVAQDRFTEAISEYERAARLWRESAPKRAAKALAAAARIWANAVHSLPDALETIERAYAIDWSAELVDEAIRWCVDAGDSERGLALCSRRLPELEREYEQGIEGSQASLAALRRARARFVSVDGDAGVEWARVLDVAPADTEAMARLEESLLLNGRAGELPRWIARHIAASDDAGIRAEAHLRLMRLYDTGLSDPEAAQRHSMAAIADAPESDEIVRAVIERFRGRAELPRLLPDLERAARRTTTADGAARLWRASAETALELGLRSRAAAAIREGLDARPGDEALLILGARHHEDEDQREAAVDALANLASPAVAASMLAELAQANLDEDRVERALGFFERAQRLGSDVEVPESLRALASPRLLDEGKEMRRTLAHIERIGEEFRERMGESNPFSNPRSPSASATERRASDTRPRMSPPQGIAGPRTTDVEIADVSTAERARREGRFEEAITAYRLLASGAADSETEAALLLEAGLIAYYDLEDDCGGLELLIEAKGLAPSLVADRYEAAAALEDAEVGDEAASATRYQERAAEATSDEERVQQLVLFASSLSHLADRQAEALAALDEAVSMAPHHDGAGELRVELLESMGRYEEGLEQALSLLALPELDPFTRTEMLRAAGRLGLESERLDAARRAYRALLDEIPADLEALSGLRTIAGTTNDPEELRWLTLREAGVLTGRLDGYRSLASLEGLERDSVADDMRVPLSETLQRMADALGDEPEQARWSELAARFRSEGGTADDADPSETADSVTSEAQAIARQAADMSDAKAKLSLLARAESLRAKRSPAAEDDARSVESSAGNDAPLKRLDQLASDDVEKALADVIRLLSNARSPAERLPLLMRRGRWTLDADRPPKEALLPLKGALILDGGSWEVRALLARAHALDGDMGAATEQTRQLADTLCLVEGENPQITDALEAIVTAGFERKKLHDLLRAAGATKWV